MFLAHGPISYLLNEKVQEKEMKELGGSNRILISLLSLFFGILPDFDMFWLVMKHLPTFIHHSIVTHSITLWVILWLLLKGLTFLLLKFIDSEKFPSTKNVLKVVEKAFLIGTISHLFADILFSYVRLFYPLNIQVTLLGDIVESNLFTGYFFSIPMAIEISIIVLFVIYLYKTFFVSKKFIAIPLYSLFVVSLLYIAFVIGISLNIYNESSVRTNGVRSSDSDFDMVLDTKDFDTNNNFINNIEDVDQIQLARDTLEIIESEALVSSHGGFKESVLYRFGAFNSYRLVSQAYFKQNKSIEPVLEQYARKKFFISEYEIDWKYSELLLSYIKENDGVIALNSIQGESVQEGKLLFVYDKNGDILNLGITLEENMVGIVLEEDTRLHTHSLSELQELYSDLGELYIQL